MNKQDRLKAMVPVNATADQMRDLINEVVGCIADGDTEAAAQNCEELVVLIKELQKEMRYESLR